MNIRVEMSQRLTSQGLNSIQKFQDIKEFWSNSKEILWI